MPTVPSLFDTLVTVGVDTHSQAHVAVALDQRGARLDELAFSNDPSGFVELLDWAETMGVIDRFGVEGTGSYGAPLARWLTNLGFVVVEVNRPDRADRRRRGKDDAIDAEQAARAVQAGTATVVPKAGTGPVEAIRMLRNVRAGAVKDRTRSLNQLHALRTTAPDALRAELGGLTVTKLVAMCVRLRPGDDLADPVHAAKMALRTLARRIQQLNDEIAALDKQLDPLVAATAPTLVAQQGVGTDVAAGLLIAAGDNPQRLRSEAAFAALCGVNPIPASSGKTTRHRLNRGGNRDANRCLHVVALTRMRWNPATGDYIQRRISGGKTKPEAMRCLKRYLARTLYRAVLADLANALKTAA